MVEDYQPMHNELQIIGLKQVSKFIHLDEGMRLGDDFFLLDVENGKGLQFMNHPFRTDAYFLTYCVNGSLECEVNLQSFSLEQDSLLICLPGNITRILTPLAKETSAGRFIVLAFSKGFLSEINLDMKNASDGHFFFAQSPCFKVGHKEKRFLAKFKSILQDVMDADIPGKKGALGALFSSVFYVISGFNQKSLEEAGEVQGVTPAQVRLKLLFDNFMSLVSDYHASERGVSFYANRLGLTPKYLSKLIRQYSGRSAPDWIDSFVILEAKSLLKYSGDSIKEIVFKLNFPNPSVFYKFFKARTGLTPTEYRNGASA